MIGEVHHCDWRELARRVRDEVGSVSAVITDCPYSERTHKGHDDGTETANRTAAWAKAGGAKKRGSHATEYQVAYAVSNAEGRRRLNYAPWDASTVAAPSSASGARYQREPR